MVMREFLSVVQCTLVARSKVRLSRENDLVQSLRGLLLVYLRTSV